MRCIAAHRCDATLRLNEMLPDTTTLTIDVDASHRVSAIFTSPTRAAACLTLAHGAGAGMNHSFMAALSDALVERRIAVLRYQFPYMEDGAKRPDRPPLAQATVRAAVAAAARLAPALPLFAGGKSFGGRMTSQAQADAALPGVKGLVFVGFPLHPANKPSIARAAHLDAVAVPMLFLQGSRDALADLSLIEPVVARLAPRTTLRIVDGADHSFKVPARMGRSPADVIAGLADDIARWCASVVAAPV